MDNWLTRCLMVLAACFSTMALAQERDSIRLRLNYSDGEWLEPRDEFVHPGVDLETDLDSMGRLLTVRVDLNEDGKPEFFIRTLCGNGGCEYPIFDGRTYAYLGSVFGSEVWLLQRKSRGMAVIESFSHFAAGRGTIAHYEFNGKTYEQMSTRDVDDEETALLYKQLDAAPRIPRL
jgi:hypothetical protein